MYESTCNLSSHIKLSSQLLYESPCKLLYLVNGLFTLLLSTLGVNTKFVQTQVFLIFTDFKYVSVFLF